MAYNKLFLLTALLISITPVQGRITLKKPSSQQKVLTDLATQISAIHSPDTDITGLVAKFAAIKKNSPKGAAFLLSFIDKRLAELRTSQTARNIFTGREVSDTTRERLLLLRATLHGGK